MLYNEGDGHFKRAKVVIKANGKLSEEETKQNVLDKAAIIQKRSRKMISGANFPKVMVSVFYVCVVS